MFVEMVVRVSLDTDSSLRQVVPPRGPLETPLGASRIVFRLLPIIAFAVAAQACGGSPTDTVLPSFRFVRDDVVDTILKFVALPVQLSNASAAGVGFSIVPCTEPGAPTPCAEAEFLEVERGAQGEFVSLDKDGKAYGDLHLGARVGSGRVTATVKLSGSNVFLSDTIMFTIRPGFAVSFRLLPRDTTIAVGRSFPLRVGLLDRGGNTVTAFPVTFESRSSILSVDAQGRVTAAQSGRTYVVGTVSPFIDSVSISVVP